MSHTYQILILSIKLYNAFVCIVFILVSESTETNTEKSDAETFPTERQKDTCDIEFNKINIGAYTDQTTLYLSTGSELCISSISHDKDKYDRYKFYFNVMDRVLTPAMGETVYLYFNKHISIYRYSKYSIESKYQICENNTKPVEGVNYKYNEVKERLCNEALLDYKQAISQYKTFQYQLIKHKCIFT